MGLSDLHVPFIRKKKSRMESLGRIKYVAAILIVCLLVICSFCYELGMSSNTILPGSGDSMISLAEISAIVVVGNIAYVFVLVRKK